MSRAEVSPEEMMNVAKSLAKGEDLQDQTYSDDQSYADNSGYNSSAPNDNGQASSQNQYDSRAEQQPYTDVPQQQQYQVDSEGYGSGQQGNYKDSAGPYNNELSSNTPTGDQSAQFASQSMPQGYQNSGSNMQGTHGSQGMQASGRGFGQGFDQGFDQGLSGGPDGAQPHPGVEVSEESGPGYASRDTDLHTTGGGSGGGYETHQHHRDTFETKSVIQES